MQQIRIDFDNPGLPQSLGAVEGESQSRIFQAALYKSGAAYTAPAGAVYSIMYRGFGPQNQGWYDTIEDGAGKRAACTVSGNIVTCELARQALRVPGHLTVVLCVSDAKGYMLKSWPIMADVRNDGYEDTVEVESFFYITQITAEEWIKAFAAWEDFKSTIDHTLSLPGKAADSKATGDAIETERKRIDVLNDGGLNLKDEVIDTSIKAWLTEHPEATTTVQNESLSLKKFQKGAIPYITLSQLGAVSGGDISDILINAIKNYKDKIIIIDGVYRCYKDITISVGGWHIYALPGSRIITSNTLTIDNCSIIRMDNVEWRDEAAISGKTGLILETTVSNAIFNRCTFRGFKTACEIHDVAYVIFNDCNFVAGKESDTLVKITDYFSELSKFNRCNFEGGYTDASSCAVGIEIQAGVWFEFNSCDIANCETLLKINDKSANTRNLRFTNCTLDHYVTAVMHGDRQIASLLFDKCIFQGNGGKYTPLYLFKGAKGRISVKDCYETTIADSYCFISVDGSAILTGNFLEFNTFYSATTENVKNNQRAYIDVVLSNPYSTTTFLKTSSGYQQINTVGFFRPQLISSTNAEAYKAIPYCEKNTDRTCRIYFGINTDGNEYLYNYVLSRVW